MLHFPSLGPGPAHGKLRKHLRHWHQLLWWVNSSRQGLDCFEQGSIQSFSIFQEYQHLSSDPLVKTLIPLTSLRLEMPHRQVLSVAFAPLQELGKLPECTLMFSMRPCKPQDNNPTHFPMFKWSHYGSPVASFPHPSQRKGRDGHSTHLLWNCFGTGLFLCHSWTRQWISLSLLPTPCLGAASCKHPQSHLCILLKTLLFQDAYKIVNNCSGYWYAEPIADHTD